jgi:hypothetical protein
MPPRPLRARIGLAVVVAGVAGTLLLTRGGRDQTPAPRAVPSVSAETSATISVEGVVEETLDARVFVIGAAEPVIVVVRDGATPAAGSTVSVRGRIARFDVTELSRDLGVHLDAERLGGLTGRRCLVATDVRTVRAPATTSVVG